MKKALLKIWQKSQENTCVEVSFFKKGAIASLPASPIKTKIIFFGTVYHLDTGRKSWSYVSLTNVLW